MFFRIYFERIIWYSKKSYFYKYLKGYSDREISVKLKISRQAVNKAKNRAFKKIKKTMKIILTCN